MLSQRRVAASPYPAYKMHYPVGPVSAASPGKKIPAYLPGFSYSHNQNW